MTSSKSHEIAILVHIPIGTLFSIPPPWALELLKQAVSHAVQMQKKQLEASMCLHPVLVVLSLQDKPWTAPRATWHSLHRLISVLYHAAARQSFESGAMLLPVDIVIEGWCGYDVWNFAAESVWVDTAFTASFPGVSATQTVSPLNNAKFLTGNSPEIVEVVLKPDAHPDQNENAQEQNSDGGAFEHVALGGTFDHLHAGHKILLTAAAWLTGSRLVCGVMDPDPERLRKKTASQLMEPLEVRINGVVRFLNRIARKITHQVVPIQDDYGPTRTDNSLQAIVGSAETARGCEMVNEVRRAAGLDPLKIYIIDVISSTSSDAVSPDNFSMKISSSQIRSYLASLDAHHASSAVANSSHA